MKCELTAQATQLCHSGSRSAGAKMPATVSPVDPIRKQDVARDHSALVFSPRSRSLWFGRSREFGGAGEAGVIGQPPNERQTLIAYEGARAPAPNRGRVAARIAGSASADRPPTCPRSLLLKCDLHHTSRASNRLSMSGNGSAANLSDPGQDTNGGQLYRSAGACHS